MARSASRYFLCPTFPSSTRQSRHLKTNCTKLRVYIYISYTTCYISINLIIERGIFMTSLLQSYREQIKPKLLLIIGVVIGLLLLFNPFAFNGQQQLIFLSLLFIVYSWATKALPRTPASLLLLILFALFGNTPATQVFSFAWSPTLFLIVTTSLLSVALSKNTLIRSWMNQVIRYSKGNLFILLALP